MDIYLRRAIFLSIMTLLIMHSFYHNLDIKRRKTLGVMCIGIVGSFITEYLTDSKEMGFLAFILPPLILVLIEALAVLIGKRT